jgi:ATP-dependent RNA helicase DDX27
VQVLKGAGAAGGPPGDPTGAVLSRSIPAPVLAHFRARLAALQPAAAAWAREERVQRQLALAEREAAAAENLLLHEDEINARPARTWHQTE